MDPDQGWEHLNKLKITNIVIAYLLHFRKGALLLILLLDIRLSHSNRNTNGQVRIGHKIIICNCWVFLSTFIPSILSVVLLVVLHVLAELGGGVAVHTVVEGWVLGSEFHHGLLLSRGLGVPQDVAAEAPGSFFGVLQAPVDAGEGELQVVHLPVIVRRREVVGAEGAQQQGQEQVQHLEGDGGCWDDTWGGSQSGSEPC